MYQTGTVEERLEFIGSGDSIDVAPEQRATSSIVRPLAAGKFIQTAGEKLWIKGVTYGTFRSEGTDTDGYPAPHVIESDFAAMAAVGINTLRTYTVPPKALLDTAHKHGLRVMVGLPWEQHVAFLDDRAIADGIVARVRDGVRSCARHPAVFCYAVGNEIPAPIVRWHGRRRVENFIRRLYDVAKSEDPSALVTYVNYPTTEYLQLPFLDIVCFNVYLESEEKLSAYLARLQNLAGERPLVLAEIGLDSRRNGEAAQAASLGSQLHTVFAAGCAGAFVFGWTDEWFRGGYDIDDWDFGLTTRERSAKPALLAVQSAYAAVPFPSSVPWPRVSVVICSYNGARTLRDTLNALKQLDYPDHEIVVVNDGSTDATPEIVIEYGVQLISTENRGLSSARNTGWQAATGEIIAYIDDDAYPDPHWLKYLAYTFITTSHVAVGGPNIAPAGDGVIADCVANSPGGPVHVLLSDTVAEHIPGCNMAFRRSALSEIGGFDPRFRTAGDDVDICWRLMEGGATIGFHAGAMDWHHRRNCMKTYWRQQKGYGKAEALLEEKWPEHYNAAGHLTWGGRLYGRGFALPLQLQRSRIYGGVWGTAGYQSLYRPGSATVLELTLMPEWYFVIGGFALLALVGLWWAPLMLAFPLLMLAVAAPLAQAAFAATRAHYPAPATSASEAAKRWLITFSMHVMQPVARLVGRVSHGLTPWRRRGNGSPRRLASSNTIWSEQWAALETWIERLESAARSTGAVVFRGGDFDTWDLHLRGGLFGATRVVVAAEEHGAGKQLVRVRSRAHVPRLAVIVITVVAMLGVLAIADGALTAAVALSAIVCVLSALVARDCAASAGAWAHAVESAGACAVQQA